MNDSSLSVLQRVIAVAIVLQGVRPALNARLRTIPIIDYPSRQPMTYATVKLLIESGSLPRTHMPGKKVKY